MQTKINAEKLAKSIREVAKHAHSEEDVRFGVEHALTNALGEMGVKPVAEYEKSLFSGSADAVYGQVLIEYKRAGRLAEKGFPQKLTQQISKYLFDIARNAGGREKQIEALEKMVGVGLDGNQILFMRYSASGRKRGQPTALLPGSQMSFFDLKDVEDFVDLKGGFDVTGPVPVSTESIDLLLLYLRSLSRKPLTSETLAKTFGPQSEVARNMVNALYSSLVGNLTQPRVATFFAEWQRIFGIVYGEEIGEAEKDASELAALYGATAQRDIHLQPMFFAVHTYYLVFAQTERVSIR